MNINKRRTKTYDIIQNLYQLTSCYNSNKKEKTIIVKPQRQLMRCEKKHENKMPDFKNFNRFMRFISSNKKQSLIQ